MISSNKSAERIFHVRKKGGEEKDRERGKRDGGRCHHGSTISAPSGVCPPSIHPLSPAVPVNFLKATRLARGYNSRRFGPPSTAGTDVRVGIRLPFAARHGRESGTSARRWDRDESPRDGQSSHRKNELAQSCGVCNSAGGMRNCFAETFYYAVSLNLVCFSAGDHPLL